ncbi:hypothetical protein NL676_029631 [Syzygium grande]|nr:hypothetical protein NL676_029631 [Syzygium grande]
MSELDALAIATVGDKGQEESSRPKRTRPRDITSSFNESTWSSWDGQRRTQGLQDAIQWWTCYALNNPASEAISPEGRACKG